MVATGVAEPVVPRDLWSLAAFGSRRLGGLRGRGRVAQWLFRFGGRSAGTWSIPMRRGHRMAVPRSSAESWSAAFTGHYDDELVDFGARFVAAGSLVLDVGASFGFWTIPLARAAREVGSRVVAIEPVARNASILRGNVHANGLEAEVVVAECALGEVSGEVEIAAEPGGCGNAVIVPDRPDASGGDALRAYSVSRVASVPLDALRSRLPAAMPVSFVKIDVEGFEMSVLRGGPRVLAADRPVILGEFNPYWLEKRGVSGDAPEEWARLMGYVVWEVHGRRASAWQDALSVRLTRRAAGREALALLLVPAERRFAWLSDHGAQIG